jgi:hypothetical protein
MAFFFSTAYLTPRTPEISTPYRISRSGAENGGEGGPVGSGRIKGKPDSFAKTPRPTIDAVFDDASR